MYETYKSAKRHYRQTCHKAMQNKIAMPLHSAKNSKQFWNIVRKKNDVQDDAISNSTLTEYFQEKMSSSINPTDVITEAEVTVRQKYNRLTESLSNNNVHVV